MVSKRSNLCLYLVHRSNHAVVAIGVMYIKYACLDSTQSDIPLHYIREYDFAFKWNAMHHVLKSMTLVTKFWIKDDDLFRLTLLLDWRALQCRTHDLSLFQCFVFSCTATTRDWRLGTPTSGVIAGSNTLFHDCYCVLSDPFSSHAMPPRPSVLLAHVEQMCCCRVITDFTGIKKTSDDNARCTRKEYNFDPKDAINGLIMFEG